MSHLALRFIGILIAVGVLVALAAFPRPHASDAASPDEITISSLAAGGPVAVGATFTVDLRITASTAPHIAVQWEIAYDANLSYVAGSAGYTCSGEPGGIYYPHEYDLAPTERAGNDGLASLTLLGSGAYCATTLNDYHGSAQTGHFVTAQLECRAAGPAQVIVVTYGNDPR
jgi:hypothetical protein